MTCHASLIFASCILGEGRRRGSLAKVESQSFCKSESSIENLCERQINRAPRLRK